MSAYQQQCSNAFPESPAECILRKWRGIEPETAARFGVGYDSKQTCIVFPYWKQDGSIHRFKLRDKDGQRYTAGEGVIPFGLSTMADRDRVFVCEGETDTLRLAQELPEEAVIGIPGAQSIGCLEAYLPEGVTLYSVFDTDKAGKLATAKAIEKYGSRPVILPGEAKDVCEYFQAGHSLNDFLSLVVDADVLAEEAKEGVAAMLQPVAEAATQVVEKETEDDAQTSDDKSKPTVSEKLVRLGEAAELFHTEDDSAFASVEVNGHTETWPLDCKGFRQWLQREYWRKYGKVPGSQAMQDVLGVLAAMAIHDGAEHTVYIRVAGKDDAVYIDLGGDTWEAVEITAEGWKVIPEAPVKFRRAKGMKPLPCPEGGGSIDDLRDFVNIHDEAVFVLYAGFLVGALNPNGPYPVLVINGEQDSAKTTAQRVARRIIDPYGPEFRSTPRDELNFVIGAKQNWILAFDNLSHIPAWLSDAICRLATGGGYATRTLYANDEETLFEATRPQLLNGIGDIATRGDLLSRALVIVLPPIPANQRKSEADFWEEFEIARPRILGALYDAVSMALRNRFNVKVDSLPRMADFATWVTAAEPALGWAKNTFIDSYQYNRQQANELALEASPLTPFICDLAESGWQGPPSELLVNLNDLALDSLKRLKAWPKSTKALANELNRLAPDLRATGIYVERVREGGTGKRFWTIEKH